MPKTLGTAALNHFWALLTPTPTLLLHAHSLWVLLPCSHSFFLSKIFPQKEGVSLTLFLPYLLPLLTAHLSTILSLGLIELAFLFMSVTSGSPSSSWAGPPTFRLLVFAWPAWCLRLGSAR